MEITDKQNNMNLQQFGPWLQEKTGAEIRVKKDRVDCVVSIDHIEAGSFIALYALTAANELLLVELVGYFPAAAKAWEALKNNEETYSPLPFADWVEQQYITDRNARVESLVL